ncbi:MAG: hypothetical protein OER96_00745 [Gammaproteobacteria bacterium]|nr:hypothetical protein [Gammaproteobacteria bacterium]
MFWLSLVILLVVALSLHFWSARQFQKRINNSIESLKVSASTNHPIDINTLPTLISKFAERATAQQHNTPKLIHIHQRGEIRMKPNASWQSFKADQYFSTYEPGFIWIAKIKMTPFISVTVVDSYVDRQGNLQARLFDSIPLTSATSPQLDQGELMRYIAELVWNPAAVLFNLDLHFTMLDDETAAASIGGSSVELSFNKSGDITRIFAPNRPRTVGTDSIPAPWEGKFFDYAQVGPYRVPKRGEVAWLLEEGIFTYWRGEIVEIKSVEI